MIVAPLTSAIWPCITPDSNHQLLQDIFPSFGHIDVCHIARVFILKLSISHTSCLLSAGELVGLQLKYNHRQLTELLVRSI